MKLDGETKSHASQAFVAHCAAVKLPTPPSMTASCVCVFRKVLFWDRGVPSIVRLLTKRAGVSHSKIITHEA